MASDATTVAANHEVHEGQKEIRRTGPPIGQKKRALKPGDRVALRYDDGWEEPRIVAIGPKRLKFHAGPKWVIWLDDNMGWFALWRVRPA